MNKWQTVDYIYWNLNSLDEADIWHLLDEINDSQAVSMMKTWLYQSQPPGSVFAQAQGILEWHQEKQFITQKQRRWLLMAICGYWDKTNCELYNSLII